MIAKDKKLNLLFNEIAILKNSEKRLKQSEESYHGLFNNVTDAIFILDKNGTFINLNKGVLAMYGYTKRFFKGKSLQSISPTGKNDLAAISKAIKQAYTGESCQFELWGKRKNREVFPMLVRLDRVKYFGKKVIIAFALDISDIKRKESEYKKNQEILKKSQEIAHIGSWIFNIKEDRFTWSDEVYRIFKSTPQQFSITYDTFFKFVHPDDRKKVDIAYKQSLKNKSPYEIVHRIVRPDGSVRIVREKAEHAYDDNGKIFQSIGMVHDITEQVEATEKKMELERQVQYAQKMESLGVLAGGIAHDFNNLLTSIMGHADLASLNTPNDSPVHNNLKAILDASRRAAELANQMLVYSGQGKRVVKKLDLSDLVLDILELIKASLSKKITLKRRLIHQIKNIHADPIQIQQVIMNLVLNASEAIGKKEGIIKIVTGSSFCDKLALDTFLLAENITPGYFSFLEVSDNGCGMDNETISKIFEPFFSTKFTGRGLGMATVSGIIRGHKGAIRINSVKGKGTNIKVFFPAFDKEEMQKTKPISSSPKKSQISGTILLVDDEDAVQMVAREMLQSLGLTVYTANNGIEAIDFFLHKNIQIDLVMLDLTMPKLDGEETFLRLHTMRPDLPVVLCSGYDKDEISERFEGKGLAGFLQKPFRMAELAKTLSTFIKN